MIVEILALSILVICSIIGFIAIFFTTFGTLIILVGALLYAALTKFTVIGAAQVVILLILYFIGELFEYISVAVGAKKVGASNRAIVGALIGGIAGAIFGAPLLGIGIFLGTLLGIFCGAFLAELTLENNVHKSVKAGVGSVIGRIGSIIVKVFIAIAMFSLIAIRIITK